jgi:ADP-ribosylglycohydrolase
MASASEGVELNDAYQGDGFDPLNPRDLLADEVRQRRETGFDVGLLIAAANEIDPYDDAEVLDLVDRADECPRTGEWRYEEPDDLDAIRSALPDVPLARRPDPNEFDDRVHAAWLGRIAGCNLGKPVEDGVHWTVERIRQYLEAADAYPLDDYVPLLDPMPAEFRLRDNWPETTRGNIAGSSRDDDIDYSILAVHLLETHGAALRPQDVGDAWTLFFPLRQLYTAERAVYINLTDGYEPPITAVRRNPYREWIGAQIRGDVFGYVFAGDPWAAAATAYQDAALSHVGNGIYGEMWSAALNAAAFTASSAHEAIAASLHVVPPRSRLHEAVSDVLGMFEGGLSWDQAVQSIRARYGHYTWVHTVNNAAVVAAGLLWADGDYATAVGRTVMSGWDTDSNGATVGSVAAILAGRRGLPERFVAPLLDRTRSALFGFDNSRISELSARTVRLHDRLAPPQP